MTMPQMPRPGVQTHVVTALKNERKRINDALAITQDQLQVSREAVERLSREVRERTEALDELDRAIAAAGGTP